MEQPRVAQLQHHFWHTAGKEHLDRRMIPWTVRQGIDQAWGAAIDVLPIGERRSRQAGGMSQGRDVQQEVRRSADCGVDHHRVLERSLREHAAHREPALGQAQQRARRTPRKVEPDRFTGRAERTVRQTQADRFCYDLRGGRGAEKLATAPWCAAGATALCCRLLQGDQAVREARADRLHLARVFGAGSGQGHAAGDDDARQLAAAGEREQRRWEPFVAGSDAHHAATLRQGADQSP
jgi:hypothetical protein